jgi:hypothetical protein
MTCPLDDPHDADDHDCEEMGRHAQAGSKVHRAGGGFLVIPADLIPKPTADTVEDPETL